MTYNDALIKNALLQELSFVKGLSAKAMTEKILLGIHYAKAGEEWQKARQAIEAEQDATDEAKNNAMAEKVAEDCALEDRRMSSAAFEQVVEAALSTESIPSFLAGAPAPDTTATVPTEYWLQVFAQNLVAE